MKLIVCSAPGPLKDEQELVRILFEQGLVGFHLRKPGWSKEQLRKWLEDCPAVLHESLMIHSHGELAMEFNLKGMHIGASVLTEKIQEQTLLIETAHREQKLISTSVHNRTETDRLQTGWDYAWLSPVFESISKPGYGAGTSDDEIDLLRKVLKEQKQTEVFALGGIQPELLQTLSSRGFDGAVVLGAVWQNVEGFRDRHLVRERINKLLSACQSTVTS